VPALPLAPGRYDLTFVCSQHRHALDRLDRAATIDVEAADYFGTGNLPYPDHGPILVDARWRLP
jgi:hypothetical protein